MLTKSFTLLFYLKKRNNYVKGELPIYMRLTVDGQRIEISTKRECEPEKWNSSAGRKNGTKEDAKLLNAYLDTLQSKVYDVHRQLIESGRAITAESVKNILVGTSVKPKMILEIFQEHNDKMSKLVGTDFAPGTLERYKTSFEHTKEFIKYKYRSADLEIEKLDYDFIADYEFWMKAIRKCSHNTTMKYLSNFKKISLLCIKRGWLARDPFHAYKMTKHEVDRQALTGPELQAITNRDFGQGRLAQVCDIFLFCCYTGLAYADVFKLKRSEIIDGSDGEKWIVIKRQKTDSPSRIPLLPQALFIISAYNEHPQCIAQDRLLPVLSNQKMNSYLKEISDLCGIKKQITFHLARHTFATTVTLTNGVPIESVSKMLGHRNIKTTQLYAKIVDKKISDDMRRLKEVLGTS
ncbi:site-specific integrase [Dyadobacter fanqingshengii]|uniref:Site-specific integrase n=1 Tax=Dyadobacter fanqingshengii TaxID=2906443 RepID=A0A9X1P6K0_9BACT|nr:site-specific integrase [Dyadobacter fanqingshengii]MCF0039676.1 site-specific integrase [Dyadobacter fanqingshengii]USJ38558.1 site-specific integrase [Dyadobacter fanqingshengii]